MGLFSTVAAAAGLGKYFIFLNLLKRNSVLLFEEGSANSRSLSER
jgi:hypothetical protein